MDAGKQDRIIRGWALSPIWLVSLEGGNVKTERENARWCSSRWRSTRGCWPPPEVRKKRGRILPRVQRVWSYGHFSFLAPRAVREYMIIVKAAWCMALSCSSSRSSIDTYCEQGPRVSPLCLSIWEQHSTWPAGLLVASSGAPASAGVPWMLKLCWHSVWSYG